MKIGDDVRVGDLWHSDATGTTCLIVALSHMGPFQYAECLDISDLTILTMRSIGDTQPITWCRDLTLRSFLL